MAEGTQIGSLYYDIGAPGDKLEKDLDNADSKVGQFGKNLHDNLNKVAVGLGVAGAGLTLLAKNATDFTVDLVKSSKNLGMQIGTTTEEASRLVAAFGRMGVSAESASQVFGIFSKNISKATQDAKDGGKDTADAFDKLGISTLTAQGAQKDFNTLLFEVADKFKSMPNGIEKTTTALELFGRSGKDMIKVLNLGSDGIKDLEEQADKLGLTLTSQNIASVSEYIKSQKDLKQSTDALKIAIGTTTAPVLTQFNTTINDVFLKLLQSDGIVKTLTVDFLAFGGPILSGSAALVAFGANLVTMWPVLAAVGVALWGFVAALAAAFIAALPFILIGAAIAAVALTIYYKWNDVVWLLHFIWDWIVQNWPYLLGALFGPFGMAAAFIVKHLEEVKAAVKNAAADAWHWLYDAGAAIIHGLAQGIKDRIMIPVNAIKDVGHAIIKAAQVTLEWHSPSKIFTEAGRSIGEGMALGINRSANMALSAMNNLGNAVISPTLSPIGAGALGGSSSSTTNFGDTVVNVGTINNSQDEAYVLRRLDRNQELEGRGGSPVTP